MYGEMGNFNDEKRIKGDFWNWPYNPWNMEQLSGRFEQTWCVLTSIQNRACRICGTYMRGWWNKGWKKTQQIQGKLGIYTSKHHAAGKLEQCALSAVRLDVHAKVLTAKILASPPLTLPPAALGPTPFGVSHSSFCSKYFISKSSRSTRTPAIALVSSLMLGLPLPNLNSSSDTIFQDRITGGPPHTFL